MRTRILSRADMGDPCDPGLDAILQSFNLLADEADRLFVSEELEGYDHPFLRPKRPRYVYSIMRRVASSYSSNEKFVELIVLPTTNHVRSYLLGAIHALRKPTEDS